MNWCVFGACFFLVLCVILTNSQYSLADDRSSQNKTNVTTTQPPAARTTTQPATAQPTTAQPRETDSPVVNANAEKNKEEDKKASKPKKSHTGRVAAAVFIGVTFSLTVCGLMFYKIYKTNSDHGVTSGGYSHPGNRLSNCLELQSATVSETRPIMQTTVETEGIDGLESDMPAYAV